MSEENEEPFVECVNCGCASWHIRRKSLEKGDKPTIAVCAGCGLEIYV